MKINELIEKTNLKQFGTADINRDFEGGYASDLLSDVMGNAKEKNVWITMQTHKNVVAVASLKDIAAIVFSNGNTPESDTIEAANEEDVILLGTTKGTYEICGEIYQIAK
ncbi:MAG: serine kinase [Bacteroidales bacterium]|jgi:hypothetical protein|nr:serine kinase [Bacteroidales bacterium]MDD2204884.1 serine kinase [Bacteroidales bacterium]MDD3151537.1 serine kinase [Bacteroidales bacterium]MDD3913540.1 serine kinase [Bacteroidales bacterium]MDD4634149.1 serine kinase [Bacteroidales bacterium]